MEDIKFIDCLERLRVLNLQRCPYFGHTLCSWSLPEWSNALAGEVGELCNLVKKNHRNDDLPNFHSQAGKECADIVIYLDLFCQRAGIDLRTEIMNKFDEVSKRVRFPVKFLPDEQGKSIPL